jgi:hypothetical protein
VLIHQLNQDSLIDIVVVRLIMLCVVNDLFYVCEVKLVEYCSFHKQVVDSELFKLLFVSK